MRAFTIKNLKDFMNQLLLADTFDYFSVSEASITTFVTFSIDGSLHPDFYDSDTAARLKAAGKSQVRWSGIKSWCYSVIRGKRTPVSFRFIFLLPEDRSRALCAAALLAQYGQRPGESCREIAEILAKNLTKHQIMRTIELLQKYRGECAYNVGVGHVLGALAVELEEIL